MPFLRTQPWSLPIELNAARVLDAVDIIVPFPVEAFVFSLLLKSVGWLRSNLKGSFRSSFKKAARLPSSRQSASPAQIAIRKSSTPSDGQMVQLSTLGCFITNAASSNLGSITLISWTNIFPSPLCRSGTAATTWHHVCKIIDHNFQLESSMDFS